MRVQTTMAVLFAVIIASVPLGIAQVDPMEVAFTNHDFLRTIELAKSVTSSSSETYGEVLRSLNSGVEHEVELKLHWTSDCRQLSGTATYRFSREPFGPARDMLIQAYPLRTVDITLTRK